MMTTGGLAVMVMRLDWSCLYSLTQGSLNGARGSSEPELIHPAGSALYLCGCYLLLFTFLPSSNNKPQIAARYLREER